MSKSSVVILDYGSQYAMLIARRVRECRVYSELVPWDASEEEVLRLSPAAFILSGGPASVYEEGAPFLPPYLLKAGVPVLGICYGMQLLAKALGGKVAPAPRKEFGPAFLEVLDPDPLFAGLPPRFQVWMSHGDRVEELPPDFKVLAKTENSPLAAIAHRELPVFGLQFHPEVVHTPLGKEIIANFLFRVCRLEPSWTPGFFIEESIKRIREQIGGEEAVAAISGGVDSTVAATLVAKAIGKKLHCIFVDHGLLREGERDRVLSALERTMEADIRVVEAEERFLQKLRGITDPEEKRRIVGEEFIRVFTEEARLIGPIRFLVQGTIYPDVIESRASPTGKAAARIKTHHNVGGLPQDMPFELVEPLRFLFKDEVREVGLALGLSREVVYRQPFPGPGLAVRILGEVTPERLRILRAADAILCEEVEKAGMAEELWQYFAVLTPLRSVGVRGDARAYDYVIAIRAVVSTDGMTADWARLPFELLTRISSRIVNEVPGVGRVVYDITSKPPATIEWE
ncbi:MAG: glutamine-hydrolyzing GMP synthase [Anaerolineae bacterium]|nr:glutamine-hydrolyzing GMP synthase [Anaerolineae bacterium]MDW8102717.1 glutamine-hydrolyzing GMP synthase [Anaerolineae bacterium]